MDASELLSIQHARLHSAVVSQASGGSLADVFLGGLTDDQMRLRPAKGMNSVAWLLWHMARAEDVFVNVVIRAADQVYREDWLKRLNVSHRDIGTGMTEDEVAELSEQIDIAAAREYRDEVGRQVRAFVMKMRPEDWEGDVEAGDMQRAVTQGAFGPRAGWLEKTFQGRTRASVLASITIIHNAEHLGEALTVRSQAGLGLGM